MAQFGGLYAGIDGDRRVAFDCERRAGTCRGRDLHLPATVPT
jgi:hypothetical protein